MQVLLWNVVETLEGFKGGGHERQRIVVLDGDVISSMVVDQRPQGFVFLFHEDSCPHGRRSKWSPADKDSLTCVSMAHFLTLTGITSIP